MESSTAQQVLKLLFCAAGLQVEPQRVHGHPAVGRRWSYDLAQVASWWPQETESQHPVFSWSFAWQHCMLGHGVSVGHSFFVCSSLVASVALWVSWRTIQPVSGGLEVIVYLLSAYLDG